MRTRIKQLVSLFGLKHIDAFLVTKDINIRYLTGFPSEESWLLLTPEKDYYITDFRYVLEARRGLKGVQIKQYVKSIYAMVADLARENGIKRLGFDGRFLSLAQFKALKRVCAKGVKLVEVNDFVEDLRAVKEKSEIHLTREALAVHHKAYKMLKRFVRPGISERQVLERLESFAKAEKVGFSFPPIVASGPNSCYPHAKVTDRVIGRNDLVLIDMGIDYKGYKSDLTRMFFLGRIPELIRRTNASVDAAQRKAIDGIKPGVACREVDHLARNFLSSRKLEKYFGHALGHGVGLEIHEGPRLAQACDAVLKEGMIVTVEPAVYIPGKFGIRIEDMILVTKQGCEILSDDIH